MKLDGQVSTVIDTILLIARAILAVLYGRVIHSLRNDNIGLPVLYHRESLEVLVAETVKQTLSETLVTMRQEMMEHIGTGLSQTLDERLTLLDMKQADALARFKDERGGIVRETAERVMHTLETVIQEYRRDAEAARHVPGHVIESAPYYRGSVTQADRQAEGYARDRQDYLAAFEQWFVGTGYRRQSKYLYRDSGPQPKALGRRRWYCPNVT